MPLWVQHQKSSTLSPQLRGFGTSFCSTKVLKALFYALFSVSYSGTFAASVVPGFTPSMGEVPCFFDVSARTRTETAGAAGIPIPLASTSTLNIFPLNKNFDRTKFVSGDPDLDQFLKRFARQQQERHFNKTFIAVNTSGDGKRVVGFVSLSAGSIKPTDLPLEEQKNLPHYDVPVVLIGQLARDIESRGQRVGESMLLFATNFIKELSESWLGVYAVIVDAKEDDVIPFYEKYGFKRINPESRRLYLKVDDIRTR
jgi:hypothetical protein